MLATSLCLVLMPVLSPPFVREQGENLQGEMGSIWVGMGFETTKWTLRKADGKQDPQEQQAKRQGPGLLLLFSEL